MLKQIKSVDFAQLEKQYARLVEVLDLGDEILWGLENFLSELIWLWEQGVTEIQLVHRSDEIRKVK